MSPSSGFSRKHLLGIRDLTLQEIEEIFQTARSFLEVLDRPIRKLPTLRGKTVLNLFFEPSTRTQASFDLAAKRLSADTVSISRATSSVVKGETLLDTLRNLEAMKIDAVVVRHSSPGVPHFLARHTQASVINAGDGAHEHPTQALLDMFTAREHFGHLEGRTLLMIGDILHSRVARSNLLGFRKMGARVILCGPPPLVPPEFEALGGEVCHDLDAVLPEADIVMPLRIQRERLEESFFPTLSEYRKRYGITAERMARTKETAVLMHPGPVNWGVELDPQAQEVRPSLILKQVTHGVAIRMAVLYLLIGGGHA